MIRKIAVVTVYVEDQQRALDFWTRQVGFEVMENAPMGPEGNWIEVAPPNVETRLVLYPRAAMPNWAELKPSMVLETEDIEATVKQLKANGVTFKGEIERFPFGGFITFVDPDGNEFLLKGN